MADLMLFWGVSWFVPSLAMPALCHFLHVSHTEKELEAHKVGLLPPHKGRLHGSNKQNASTAFCISQRSIARGTTGQMVPGAWSVSCAG